MSTTEKTKANKAAVPTTPLVPAVGNVTLDEKVRALRQRMNQGLRHIEPLTDMMGYSPNKVTSKAPEPLEMRPEELYVDAAYQRDLSRSSMRLILKIINNWDWRKFKPPVVTLTKDSKYVAIDGQHTSIAAATHPGIPKIPVMFVAMEDVADQANAFVSHNTANVKVGALDLFHAKLTGKNVAVQEIHEAVTKAGITVNRYAPGAAGLYEPNQTIAIGTITYLYNKYGILRLKQIMGIVAKCGFAPISADHMRAIAILLYDRESGEPELSAEYLVELIKSLNDADAKMNAAKMAATTKQTKSRALAQYYRNQYREHYGRTGK